MRLIDATRITQLALLERDKIPLTIVQRYSFGTESPNHHGQSMRGGIRKVLRLIEQAPTIDAVPVVRCKDCKHHDVFGWCAELERGTVGEAFCAYGERKER